MAALALAEVIWDAVVWAMYYNPTWRTGTNDYFLNLGVMQLVAVSVIFFIAVWGIIAFLMESNACVTIWLIFDFLATLFLAAIAIISIVFAYKIRQENQAGAMLSCRTRYGGILNMYNNMDQYLQQVDQGLCSTQCPCGITNPTSVNNWKTYYNSVYNTWTVNPTSNVNNFGLCPAAVQTSAYNNGQKNYALQNPVQNSSYNSSFNYTALFPYWAYFENKFNCTGFCNTTYINGNGQNISMVKYLFTDVNRGIPSTLGCLPSIFTWLTQFLDVWGGIALTIAALLFAVFLLACTYVCCSRDAKYEREPIPVIPVPVPNSNRLVTDNQPVIVRPGGIGGQQELRQY